MEILQKRIHGNENYAKIIKNFIENIILESEKDMKRNRIEICLFRKF